MYDPHTPEIDVQESHHFFIIIYEHLLKTSITWKGE